MSKNVLVAPIVKWVGGKRQLLKSLKPLLPKRLSTYTYCEPFVGGGALVFDLQPQNVSLNDINAELMNVYRIVRDDVEYLIAALQEFKNDSDFFYQVRDWDRDKDIYNKLSGVQKAARSIYLNKTCYNGLFRVNNAGEFNSPFGNYRNPNIVNAPILRAVSSYLRQANVTLSTNHYATILETLPKKSFVYLDPPYDPISVTSNFTGYSREGFNREEQIRLRGCCDRMNEKGIKFMLSNSATDFIKEQYSAYNICIVQAKRNINSDANKRGDVPELVVRNYE